MKTTIISIALIICVTTNAQIEFQEHNITAYVSAPSSIHSADIDGDGDMDVLSSSWQDDKIAWYENIDGQGSIGSQRIITTNADFATSVFSADIDGDDDIDVLSSSSTDNTIAWYENLDGFGEFSGKKVITTDALGAQSVYSSDIDNDGDMDVLSGSAGDNKIAWYENIDGLGNFGAQQIISTLHDEPISVLAIDIDGDNDMDVLSGSVLDNKIAWYENTDGQGSFGEQQIITTNADRVLSVYAIDIDGDGDIDVLSASQLDDKIAWYENTDGQGSFGAQQILTTNANSAASVYAVDIDGDDDVDVLSASRADNKIAWYENLDGQGNFGAQQNISINATSANFVYAADIDGDGDNEILYTFFQDNIVWHENTDGKGNFGPMKEITIQALGARSVFSIDIDGDGDMDVLSASASDDKIAWYENINSLGGFGPQHIISTNTIVPLSVYAVDLDGDNDADVLSASVGDNKIAWYENEDGQGNFGSQQIITINADGAWSVYSTDIDNDSDMDVLSASENDNKIAWYENTDGQGSFGAQQVISTATSQPRSVYASDLDGDGDMDVLSASRLDDKIAWYENMDGQGSFGAQQIISTNADLAFTVFSADIDSDGDMDVLSSSYIDDKIAWYENTDGEGNFSSQKIISTIVNGAVWVHASDIDGDSDMDVFSASFNDDQIAWYENLDGNGNFGSQQIITENAIVAVCVYTADIDGDGNMDVLSASQSDGKIIWYENLSLSTSITNVTESNYIIYPIPTEGNLTVQSNTIILQIEIYNTLGQLVLLNTHENEIDVSSLSQGLYFIKVKDENGNFGIKKIMKN